MYLDMQEDADLKSIEKCHELQKHPWIVSKGNKKSPLNKIVENTTN